VKLQLVKELLGLSNREIEQKFGIPKSTAQKAFSWLKYKLEGFHEKFQC